MMVESGLIAEGSLRGLIGGTHFNRCKRIHPAVAVAFRALHFDQFFGEYSAFSHDMKLEFAEIIEIINRDTCDSNLTERTLFELKDVLEHYASYEQKTLNGEHGCTAKYVLSYVHLIELYHLFERAIQTSDLDLYIYAAYKMCPIFFIFNHQNYARYLTRNLDDSMNCNTELREEFSNGALSVRRTNKNFCRSPIDLTLEQTVNANAANKLTGISAFTNSLNARQRWSETYIPRMEIISELMEYLGLSRFQMTESSSCKLFDKQVKSFTDEIKKNINPFSADLNPAKLFNLSTGKSASTDTAEFLMNFEKNGTEQMQKFINECKLDPNRFDRPLKRNALKNFSVELFKNKHSAFKGIDQTKAERNILGQILCLALKKEIDLESLFSYPLTSVPHSLAHFDGSMVSNQKGDLTAILMMKSDNQQSNCSIDFEVDVIEGFYLLATMRESPTKYGQLAKFVLQKMCNTTAHEVHVFFDKKERPSPRDIEINKQKDLFDRCPPNFTIKGPNQELGQSLVKCLASNSFREELISFFIKFWSEKDNNVDINPILNGKRIFVSFGSKCYLFSEQHEKGK